MFKQGTAALGAPVELELSEDTDPVDSDESPCELEPVVELE
jgi:hypothetical protein